MEGEKWERYGKEKHGGQCMREWRQIVRERDGQRYKGCVQVCKDKEPMNGRKAVQRMCACVVLVRRRTLRDECVISSGEDFSLFIK